MQRKTKLFKKAVDNIPTKRSEDDHAIIMKSSHTTEPHKPRDRSQRKNETKTWKHAVDSCDLENDLGLSQNKELD